MRILFIIFFIQPCLPAVAQLGHKDSLPGKQAVPAARITPNPVKNRCELQVKNFSAGQLWVIIYNSSGTVVYKEKRLAASADDQVVLFLRLPPGNYVCTIIQQQKRARLLFVISP
jgi:hypothetical protein